MTALIALLEPRVPALGLGVLYVLAVVPIALVYGGAVAGAFSVASILAFDFFFLAPRQSLDPGTSEQWEVLVAFLVSSLVVGQLAARSQREVRRSARLAEEQSALRRVATLVARGVPPEELFAAVAEEVGRMLPVGSAAMGRYDPDGMFTTVAAWSTGTAAFPVGRRWIPEGKNVMTIVFETGRPARMDNFVDASGPVGVAAREAGYRSAVGTPITVVGHLWGVMTAASSSEQPLPAGTEARLASFTELVATAIANTESRAALGYLAAEQAALRRVATLVAEGMQPAKVFSALCDEVNRLLDAQTCVIVRLEADGNATVVADSGTTTPELALGTNLKPQPGWVLTAALETGRTARKDDFDDTSERTPRVIGGLGIQSAVGVPIVVQGAQWGVIIIGTDSERFPDDTEQRLEEFTELAATAIANAESRSELAASRARIVATSDETRRRIERNLHDGAARARRQARPGKLGLVHRRQSACRRTETAAG